MFYIYSKTNCNACDKDKKLLEDENYEYEIKMLDVDFNIIELYDVVPKSVRSFPCIQS